MNNYPKLPVFLNRKLNGIEPTPLKKKQKSQERSNGKATIQLWFGPTFNTDTGRIEAYRKRGFADGFHRATLVKLGTRHVKVQIGSRQTTIPREMWDDAVAKEISHED